MQDEIFLDLCRRQYGAFFDMIRQLIQACPAQLWDRREGEAPFWQQVCHTLWYADLYLSESPQAFQRPPFADESTRNLDQAPEHALSPEQLLGYLDQIVLKFETRLEQLGSGGLEDKNPFHWTGPTVAHNLVYNLRHAQHHAGWMASILRRGGIQPPTWRCTL